MVQSNLGSTMDTDKFLSCNTQIDFDILSHALLGAFAPIRSCIIQVGRARCFCDVVVWQPSFFWQLVNDRLHLQSRSLPALHRERSFMGAHLGVAAYIYGELLLCKVESAAVQLNPLFA